MAINSEGPQGATLTDTLKRVCTYCGGSKFYMADQVDTPGVGEELDIMCVQCGYEEGLDLEVDCGAAENYSD